MGMKKQMLATMGATLLSSLMDRKYSEDPELLLIDDKIPTPILPVVKKQRVATPPRSMTSEELEYYKVHKNLNGFKAA
jgi:hypothetical protein